MHVRFQSLVLFGVFIDFENKTGRLGIARYINITSHNRGQGVIVPTHSP